MNKMSQEAPSMDETNEAIKEQFKEAKETAMDDIENGRSSAENAVSQARSVAEAMFDENDKREALEQVVELEKRLGAMEGN